MAYLYDLTDTWNAAGTVFNAIKMNVTNSASAAGSKIVSLQVGSTDRFTVDKDGNGYFSGTLQAVGAISFPNAYLSGNSGTIGMQDNTASILAYNGTGSGGITNTLRFITGASERMRINSSGNVGIGTSSPASLLHLGTTVPEIRFDDTDVSGVVQLRQSGAAFSITVDPTNVDASSNFQVAVDGSERMRIDSSGNVGIGTSAPSNQLSVAGNNTATISLDWTVDNAAKAWIAANHSTGEVRYAAVTNYFPTFYSNNNERMRIDLSGNVGIGTSSPTGKLSVSLSSATGGGGIGPLPAWDSTYAVFGNTASTSPAVGIGFNSTYGGILTSISPAVAWQSMNYLAADHIFHVSANEKMRIDSSGNVGIGTSSPSTYSGVLNVKASDRAVIGYFGGTTYATRLGANSSYATIEAVDAATGTSSYQPLQIGGSLLKFDTGGSERMRIDSSGNVGIGTSSPGGKLDVRAANIADGTNGGIVNVYSTTAQAANVGGKLDLGGLYDGSNSLSFASVAGRKENSTSGDWSGYMQFSTRRFGGDFAERMRIDSSGNFSIGNSFGNARLRITSGSNVNAPTLGSCANYPVFLSNTDGSYGLGIGVSASDGHTWFQGQRADGNAGGIYNITLNEAGGNVGIGISSPSGKLDVRGATGTTAIINSYNDSTTGNVYSYFSNLQNNGNSTSSYHYAGVTQGVNIWYLYGNGTSSWSSDQRLKKNIESTRDGYLDDLCQLRVVKYNWHTDADDKPRELGLIAQEVEAVFPGLVEEALQDIDDTGIRYKVLKGSVLPYMLLKALQEANTKIEALTARVAQLEGN